MNDGREDRLDILLVNPGMDDRLEDISGDEPNSFRVPAYGLAVLGSALKRSGFTVEVMDEKDCGVLTVPEIAGLIHTINPRTVGLSISTPCYERARMLASMLPEGTHLFLGGPHPSALPLQTFVDFATVSHPTLIVGPGEQALGRLLSGTPLGPLHGVVKKHDDAIRRFTPVLPLAIAPIDSELNPILKGKDGRLTAFLLSTRGCPHRCSFCSIHSTTGSRVVVQPVTSMMGDVSRLMKRGVSIFRFIDDLLLYSERRARAIASTFLKAKSLREITWYANARVDAINEFSVETCVALAKSGCKGIGLGLESASARILKMIRKGFTKEEAIAAVTKLRSVGIRIYCYFIIGFPSESYEEMIETVNFAYFLENVFNCRCGIVPYKLYPGTEDFLRMVGHDVTIEEMRCLARFRKAKLAREHDDVQTRRRLQLREPFTVFHDESVFSPHCVETVQIESLLREFYRGSV